MSVVSALCPHTSGLEELLNSDWLSVRKGVCTTPFRARELCESRGGRPGVPVRTVSVDVKQHWNDAVPIPPNSDMSDRFDL